MIEKVKNRRFKLYVEEYEQRFENEVEYVVYSDIKPLKFSEIYEEYGGWTTEKYLVAQDGKLYIVTQRWSSVYDCADFEVEEIKTENICIDKIGELLENYED